MNESRGGLLSAGGILSIIVGAFEVLGGGILVAWKMLGCLPLGMRHGWFLHGPEGVPNPDVLPFDMCITPMCLVIVGGVFVVLGIIAIAGGVSAIKRKSFGLSLAGAICALPSVILGILAVIFVSLGRREFGAEY